MNTDLLLKVRDRILAEPEHFDMSAYVIPKECGTTCCIAGWAIALHCQITPDQFERVEDGMLGREVEAMACRALGISWSHKDNQGYRLFHECAWPDAFFLPFNSACDKAEMARIAADRIDAFIASNGAV